MRALLTGCMLLAVALAGCADSGSDADPDDDLGQVATTGFLRGVVVDEAIRPIEGAAITISFNGTVKATVSSDANGEFGLGNLAAGRYALNVTKQGFIPETANATVEVGVQTPELVQIILVAIPTDSSYVLPFVWDGVVTCGTTYQNWCAAINFVAQVEIFPDRSFRFLFDEFMEQQRTPDYLQVEVIWEPNNDLSQWAYAAFWASTWEEWEECLCTPNVMSAQYGDGYILTQLERGPMEALDVGFSTGIGVGFSVPQPPPEEYPNNPEYTTVMVNQDFSAYMHAFYGCLPEEGWLFSVAQTDPVCDPESLPKEETEAETG